MADNREGQRKFFASQSQERNQLSNCQSDALNHAIFSSTTRNAFTAFNAENDPDGIKFAQRIFGFEDNDGVVHKAGLISEANLITCVAITRNSYDSFGQSLNGLVVPCRSQATSTSTTSKTPFRLESLKIA
ncbi:hypothetical protein V2J66_17035 [Pseudomonas alliivorans]|nr:hypothetical protein [Pseudomonas alliivorans]MEE5058435.1 hypothetical protein [Pseudomonas alliivorans]MEE5162302.1 hypothetical protein [Pseudomonas alliivorans]